MMSKKNYQQFAEVLRKIDAPANVKIQIAESLAEYMQIDNPNFNNVRFLEACGLDPNTQENLR